VLIVDDQDLFAEGLKTIIESRSNDIAVQGIAANGKKALEALARQTPDIVLLDVRMPEMDGVQTAREIHERYPRVKVVMLTTFEDDEYVKDSLRYGAVGYLLKNRPPEELIASIRAVGGGVVQLDPAAARALLHEVSVSVPISSEITKSLRTLTARERQTLRLLVNAASNREIAERMNVVEQTARNYVSTIYAKLGMTNRLEIMKHMKEIRAFLSEETGG
jgi:DNA-binding NarL/FixJ family response regulator